MYRQEKDLIGTMELPKDVLYGIHTARALTNFPLTGQTIHPSLIHAYGAVKLAAMSVNRSLGCFDNPSKIEAILRACSEMHSGLLDEHIAVDALQGGAGTSTNMNVNEVIANRALILLSKTPGEYDIISPIDDINRHQSTNDTYPTALKISSILLIKKLENEINNLVETFQGLEKKFAHIVKVGRTQFQDAVLTTLGREMAAYAECLGRDRWRLYKCEERLRVVNLGGTAIGTGLGAPRQYIFRVVDKLREITGLNLARAENLVENTQNLDVFVEVSGLIKTAASNLFKIASDLRLLSSGPENGFSEISLPCRQTGSSIMPGKINPVIPEAVTQASIMINAYDSAVTTACSMGSLELNAFLPLIAHALLNQIELLTNAAAIFRKHCVAGIEVNENKCLENVLSSTAIATALIPKFGYEKTSEIIGLSKESNQSIKEYILSQKCLTESEFLELISPEKVCQLGSILTSSNSSNF